MQDQASARIRENQRRSRARRTEYLKELEARWQQCRVTGVEASAEIQQAAKGVLSENRKLRALLKKHGVEDAEIEQHLLQTDGSNAFEPGEAASTLAVCLSTRKACGDPGPENAAPKGLSKSASATSGPLNQSQCCSKASPALSHGVPPNLTNLAVPTMGSQPALPSSTSFVPLAPNMTGLPVQLESSNITSTITAPNTSSCYSASDILTSMGYGIDDAQVRVELGCQPNIDCNVDNGTVFNLVDRYTEESLRPPQ